MVENTRNPEFTLVDGRDGDNEAILVAQADTGAPAQDAAPVQEAARVVIQVEDGAFLRLPATASIDQPRVNGTDLEFVQPDGSVIVVPEGAIAGLTIFIGAVEIPPQTVAALFQANGIEAAAGPNGPSQSSGGNFEVPVGGIGDPFAIGDLLPPTELMFNRQPTREFYPANLPPRFSLSSYSARISEEGLAGANEDVSPLGNDTTNAIIATGNLGASDPNGNPISFVFNSVTEGLTSNGLPIVWEGVGTDTLIGRVDGQVAIIATVGGSTGTYSVMILRPIDHPDTTTEDGLPIEFGITARDGMRGSASTVLTVTVEDDSPILSADPRSATVDEDGLGAGNGDTAEGDHATNSTSANGSLGIRWGADNGDKGSDTREEDGTHIQDDPSLGGRAVYFTNTDVAVTGHGGEGLTSNGLPITFSLNAAGTMLVGTVPDGEGTRVVIEVSLSDEEAGSFYVELFDNLDHAAGGAENDISLTFNFTARDADGDTVPGQFTVVVDDDMPAAGIISGESGELVLDETLGGLGNNNDEESATAEDRAFDPYSGLPLIGYVEGGQGSLFSLDARVGADQPGSVAFSLSLTAGPTDLTDAQTDSPILLKTEGTSVVGYFVDGSGAHVPVFAITVDAATGDVRVFQYRALEHDNPADHDESSTPEVLPSGLVHLEVTVTDRDGDVDTGRLDLGGRIKFEDDGPTVAVTPANAISNGLFFEGFTPNGSAWGAGSGYTSGTAGAWTITSSTSGGTGSTELQRVGDGYRGADSPTNSVMVDMEASPGNVAITQQITNLVAGESYRLSFEIGEAADAAPGSALLQVIWNGNIVGTFDPASGIMQTHVLDLVAIAGPNTLTFQEIGTSGDNTGTFLANIQINNLIIIDESAGLQPDSNDVAAAGLAGLFDGLVIGIDADMGSAPQFAQGTRPVVTASVDYGADGQGAALAYSLSVGPGATGLETTEGYDITLRLDAGRIVGVYNDGSGEKAAFALHIDAATGIVTVAQFVSLKHPIEGDSHDEGIYLPTGAILATVTATDGDNDTATATADISNLIRFEDDGPTIIGVSADSLGAELILDGGFDGHGLSGSNWSLFDTLGAWTKGNDIPFEVQAGGAGGVPGTDGAVVELDGDTQQQAGGVEPSADGTNATIQQVVNGTEAGQSYQITFQYAPRVQGGTNTAGLEVYFGGEKVFDSDDATYAPNSWHTITINVVAPSDNALIQFVGTGAQDEFGALIDNVSVRAVLNRLDDDSFGGIAGGPGDDADGNVATGTIHFDAGADGLSSIAFNAVTATNARGESVPLEAIRVGDDGIGYRESVTTTWVPDGQGGTLTGRMDPSGEPVFTATVNADGTYRLEMFAPLAHPFNDPDYQNNGAETAFEDNLVLNLAYTITDGDGDTARGQLQFNVDDDTPNAIDFAQRDVVEGGAAISGDVVTSATAGADGAQLTEVRLPGSETFVAISGSPFVVAGLGTFTFAPDGAWTFVPASGLSNAAGIDATFAYRIVDGDGDMDEGVQPIRVTDGAGPTAGAPIRLELDDERLSDGTNPAGGPVTDVDTIVFTPGSDAITGMVFGDTSGLNASLTWERVSDTQIVGRDGTEPVVQLDLVRDGNSAQVTATLLNNYDSHPAPGLALSRDEWADLGSVSVIATDVDGDPAVGTVTIRVSDDVPELSGSSQHVTIDEDDLGTDGARGSDGATGPAVLSGSLAGLVVPGADGPLTYGFTVTTGVGAALAEGLGGLLGLTSGGQPIAFDIAGNTLYAYVGTGGYTPDTDRLVFEFVLETNGNYTLRLHDNVDHDPPNDDWFFIGTDGNSSGPGSDENTDLRDNLPLSDVSRLLLGSIIKATDADGDSVVLGDRFTVSIRDDVPTANADSAQVTEDSVSNRVASGNVLTNDVAGADGVTGVTWSTEANAAAVAVLNTYGTLTLNPDGSWRFELDNSRPATQALNDGQTLSRALNYTITDADGDVSSSTLTITINGSNDGVTIGGLTPDAEGSHLVVHEDDLLATRGEGESAGSDPTKESVSQDGMFTITAPDGIQSLTVAGQPAITAGAFTPVTITTDVGQLVITDYDAATGTVRYTYTLLDNAAHPTGGDNNALSETFEIVLRDDDGNPADDATAQLTVRIVDDVPTANVDHHYVIEDDAEHRSLSGNVLDNDTAGADGVTAVTWLSEANADAMAVLNTYGTLTLNTDGSWSYVLDNSRPETQALNAGEIPFGILHYSITDGDGDVSSSILTIQVKGRDDGVTIGLTPDAEGNHLVVHEDDLLATRGEGESAGSDPTKESVSQDGTFTITAPDGIQSLTVAGQPAITAGAFTPVTITTDVGQLVITDYDAATGTVRYTYTLLDNAAHPTGGDNNALTETFEIVLRDDDGNPADDATAQLTVRIVDDVPTAANEGLQSVVEGALLTGNFDFVQGADGAALSHINGNAVGAFDATTGWSNWINLTHGQIRVKADGAYEFQARPDDVRLQGDGQIAGTFSVTDADGDRSTANFAFTVTDDADTTTVSLTATPTITEAGTVIVYTATLTNPAQVGYPVTVTLSNGTVITIPGGAPSASANFTVTADEDVYVDPGTIEATIISATGGNFESLVINPAPAGTTITDTIDTVTAKLTAGEAVHVEGGVEITYTVTLESAGGLSPIGPETDLVFTLAYGGTVTIPAGEGSISGTRTVFYAYTDISGAITNSMTLTSGGTEYENLVPQGSTSVTAGTVPSVTGSVSLQLDEAALDMTQEGHDLAPGSIDGTDPDSTGETARATSGITFTATGEAITVAFDGTAPTVTGLESGYSISWALNGGQLVGTLMQGDVNHGEAIRVALSGQTSADAGGTATPTITATLTGPLEHASGNVTITGIKVVATDASGDKASADVDVTVLDDAPQAVDDFATAELGKTVGVNDYHLTFLIDTSGSVSSSNMKTALRAFRALVETYKEGGGDVSIRVIEFNASASVVGTYGNAGGPSIDALITLLTNEINGSLNQFAPGGGTNYGTALNQVQTYLNSIDPNDGFENVLYFFTDGEPRDGTIQSVNAMNTFMNGTFGTLVDNLDLDIHAFGVGSGMSQNGINILNAIDNTDDSPIQITNFEDLLPALVNTIDPNPADGNILTNDDAFGADGGYIESITIDGVIYTFDGEDSISVGGVTPPVGHAITLHGTYITGTTALGGTLTFYFADTGPHLAGKWTYTAPDAFPPGMAAGDETLTYTLVDGDGNSSTATLSIDIVVPPNAVPVITSNGGGDTASISVAEGNSAVTTVQATDADGDARTYSIVGGADQSRFTINAATGVLTFVSAQDYENPTDDGHNNVYDVVVQAADGKGGIDTQALAVTVTNVNEAPVAIDKVTNSLAGSLEATDVDDALESLTFALNGSGNGQEGRLTVQADGTYQYALHAATAEAISFTISQAQGSRSITFNGLPGGAVTITANDRPSMSQQIANNAVLNSLFNIQRSGSEGSNFVLTWKAIGDQPDVTLSRSGSGFSITNYSLVQGQDAGELQHAFSATETLAGSPAQAETDESISFRIGSVGNSSGRTLTFDWEGFPGSITVTGTGNNGSGGGGSRVQSLSDAILNNSQLQQYFDMTASGSNGRDITLTWKNGGNMPDVSVAPGGAVTVNSFSISQGQNAAEDTLHRVFTFEHDEAAGDAFSYQVEDDGGLIDLGSISFLDQGGDVVIENYSIEDKLDFSDVLIDESAATLDSYLSTRVEGGNTIVSVDRDGAGTEHDAVDVATVINHTGPITVIFDDDDNGTWQTTI